VGFEFTAVHLASLAGQRLETLKASGRAVALTVGRGKIITVEFELTRGTP
jgi:hypothetical protein